MHSGVRNIITPPPICLYVSSLSWLASLASISYGLLSGLLLASYKMAAPMESDCFAAGDI